MNIRRDIAAVDEWRPHATEASWLDFKASHGDPEETGSTETAVGKAGFSAATGYRIQLDPRRMGPGARLPRPVQQFRVTNAGMNVPPLAQIPQDDFIVRPVIVAR